MTEADWNSCTDPRKMLTFLRSSGRVSDRKSRLWMVACCRMVWHVLPDERSRTAVAVAERFADGLASESELYDAEGVAWETVEQLDGGPIPVEHAARAAAWACYPPQASQYNKDAATAVALEAERATEGQGIPWVQTAARQADLLRDLFGPLPVRPMWIDTSWRTPTVVALAQTVYESRRSDDLPILADAAEEAGCTDARLLEHLRSPGLHARGCFALDAVLSKS